MSRKKAPPRSDPLLGSANMTICLLDDDEGNDGVPKPHRAWGKPAGMSLKQTVPEPKPSPVSEEPRENEKKPFSFGLAGGAPSVVKPAPKPSAILPPPPPSIIPVSRLPAPPARLEPRETPLSELGTVLLESEDPVLFETGQPVVQKSPKPVEIKRLVRPVTVFPEIGKSKYEPRPQVKTEPVERLSASPVGYLFVAVIILVIISFFVWLSSPF